MDKKYEIALSYANANNELSEIISYELDCTFDKAFFKDKLRMDELSVADPFGPTLRGIFRNSRFTLVLYTKEYKRGQFAPMELKEIIKKAEEEKSNNFFIIKADDSPVEETQLQDAYYIELNPSHYTEKEAIRKK